MYSVAGIICDGVVSSSVKLTGKVSARRAPGDSTLRLGMFWILLKGSKNRLTLSRTLTRSCMPGCFLMVSSSPYDGRVAAMSIWCQADSLVRLKLSSQRVSLWFRTKSGVDASCLGAWIGRVSLRTEHSESHLLPSCSIE